MGNPKIPKFPKWNFKELSYMKKYVKDLMSASSWKKCLKRGQLNREQLTCSYALQIRIKFIPSLEFKKF